jgi:anti-sigma factor RsiW
MTINISPRDWEALSAFLDDQLSTKERARLEHNLKERAELRTALEELRRTRAVLRSAPHLRAPRNFMLKAEMVGARKPASSFSGWLPAMRLTSAVASLMLIVVLFGDFLNSSRQANSMMAAQPVEAPVIQEAPTAEAAREAAPDASPEAMALQAPAPGAEPTATMQPLAAAAAEQGEYPPPGEGAAASELSLQTGLMPTVTVTITSTGEAAAAMAPPENAYPLPEMSAKIAPEASVEPAPEIVQDAGEVANMQQAVAAVPAEPFWTAWRIVELLLAVTALAAGLAALIMWRSGRP